MSRLVNIGFGNLVNAEKVLAVVSPDAAPIKRMVSRAKEDGNLIDATQGRRTKAVVVLEGGSILLSALQTDTVFRRFHAGLQNIEESKPAEDE